MHTYTHARIHKYKYIYAYNVYPYKQRAYVHTSLYLGQVNGRLRYSFNQPMGTCTYLIALAVGLLDSKRVGPRSLTLTVTP